MKAFVGTQRQSRARCWHQQTSSSVHQPAEENRRYADVAGRSGILFQAFVWFPHKENLWVIQTSDKLDTVIKINHSENAAQMPFPEKSESWVEFLKSLSFFSLFSLNGKELRVESSAFLRLSEAPRSACKRARFTSRCGDH